MWQSERAKKQELAPETADESQQRERAPQFSLPNGLADYYNVLPAGKGRAPKSEGSADDLRALHDVALQLMLSYSAPASQKGVATCVEQLAEVRGAIETFRATGPKEDFVKIAGAIEALRDMSALCNDDEDPWAKEAPPKKPVDEKRESLHEDKNPEEKKRAEKREKEQLANSAARSEQAPGIESLAPSARKSIEAGQLVIPKIENLSLELTAVRELVVEQAGARQRLDELEAQLGKKVASFAPLLTAALEAFDGTEWAANPALRALRTQLAEANALLETRLRELKELIEQKRHAAKEPTIKAVKEEAEDEKELRKAEELDKKDKEQQAQSGVESEKEGKQEDGERKELDVEIKQTAVEEHQLEAQLEREPANDEKPEQVREKKVERGEKEEKRHAKKPPAKKPRDGQESERAPAVEYAAQVPEERLFVVVGGKENEFYSFGREDVHALWAEATAGASGGLGGARVGGGLGAPVGGLGAPVGGLGAPVGGLGAPIGNAGMLIKWLCSLSPEQLRYTAPESAVLVDEGTPREEARASLLALLQKGLA